MKLDHIQLAMPKGDEEKARSFFCGVLGMVEDVKPYPLNERGGCWFRGGSIILHIGVEEDFVPQKKAHPAFLVSNFKELENKLKEEGYVVVSDEALPNRSRFYSSDPFGNRLEFIKEGDGFSQK